VPDFRTTHVTVRGRVQGVGYRAFVEREALSAGVGGWVRNRRGGSVEAVLQAEEGVLHGLIARLREGPFSARVDALDTRQATADEMRLRRPGDLFSVLPTA
jgi:acylphosphatase